MKRAVVVIAFIILQDSAALRAQVTAPPAGTIDGAERPAAIPDLVAFRLFLRSLAPQPVTHGQQQAGRKAAALNEVRKERLRQNLRLTESEVSALDAILNEFGQRVGAIDRQAAQVKPSEARSPEAARILMHLQHQRDVVILELIDALPQRLGVPAATRLRHYMVTEVKPRIRITPIGPANSTRVQANSGADR